MPTPRTIFAAILIALLAWQTVAGAWRMVDLGARDVQREGQFETEEERLARALEPHWETLQMLRAHVPEVVLRDGVPGNGLVYCNLYADEYSVDAEADVILLDRLRHALHPRIVRALDFRKPRDRGTLPPQVPPGVFLCDFKPSLDGEPPAPFESVAVTDLVELWGVPQ